MWQRATRALAAMALVAAVPVSAAEEWRNVDAAAARTADPARLEQLARDYPYSAAVRLALLNAYLEAGRKDEGWREIAFLASRGYTFSLAGQAELLELYDGDARAKLAELFSSAREPLEASELLATVPPEALLVEGVAYDAETDRLFASTIISRTLAVRSSVGRWSTIDLTGAGSLAAMALDERRRTLWIASGFYDETPGRKCCVAGVFGIDLDTGDTFRKAAPEGATPSDIALAPDGGLYASDPLSGAIYYARAELWQMWPIAAPGTFRSPQGLVPWEGGVIVSDYGYGLAFLDAGGKAWRVEADVPVLLDGIDGMWRHGDRIVAVQNGARPARIVELSMSHDGLRVTAVRELERAHRGWTEPVGGAISGDRLIYVATGQWATFGPGGALREGVSPQPTEVRTLPLLETPAPPP